MTSDSLIERDTFNSEQYQYKRNLLQRNEILKKKGKRGSLHASLKITSSPNCIKIFQMCQIRSLRLASFKTVELLLAFPAIKNYLFMKT